MINESQARELIGRKLRTSDGDKVGTIGQVYLDDHNGRPEWVTVNTGLFGTNESFVPLAEATLTDQELVVPYTKSQIKDAPNVDESSHLSEAEERDLYAHYNVDYATPDATYADTVGTTGTGTARTAPGYADTDRVEGAAYTDRAEGVGYTDRVEDVSGVSDVSGAQGADAMTRSEEQLNVGTERVQTGKARLRKWVDTENVQVDVPVRKEKAVLVTEPVTEDNRGPAYQGEDITESDHEIVLNAERPVVSKETVAQERVRLDTEVEESVETVSDDVRKERIDVEGDVETNNR